MKEPKELQFDSKTGLPIPGTAPELERPPQDPTFRFDLTGLVTATLLYGTCVAISPTISTALLSLVFCMGVMFWGGMIVDAFGSQGNVIFRILIYLFVALGLVSFYGAVYFFIRFKGVDRNASPFLRIFDVFLIVICAFVFLLLLSLESHRAKRTNTRDMGDITNWYWKMLATTVAIFYICTNFK